MRILVRRGKPASGAKLTDFEKVRGWRYQLIATNTPWVVSFEQERAACCEHPLRHCSGNYGYSE
jgi:hypothetical protein